MEWLPEPPSFSEPSGTYNMAEEFYTQTIKVAWWLCRKLCLTMSSVTSLKWLIETSMSYPLSCTTRMHLSWITTIINHKKFKFSGRPLMEFWQYMLSGCQVCDWGIQYHLCSKYRGCCGSVAEHWQLKPAVSWVQLPAAAGRFFQFPLFSLHNI